MKKRLKIIGIILGSVFILGLMFFMLCFKKEVQEHKNKEYAIDMFKLDEILSITIDTLSQYDGEKEFKDEETIEKIYKVFANRKTNVESIDDVPANPDLLYLVKFKNTSENYKLAYIYKKGNKYYIQQPYNGIYQITKDEYIIVKKTIE